MKISTGTPLGKRILRSKAFTLFLLLVVLVIFFTVMASLRGAKFFTPKTFLSILSDLTCPGFLAIGAAFLLVSGSVDLSESMVGALTGVIIAVGIDWWHWPWYGVVLLAIAAALVCGLINAILVNEIGMAPFIATMAMSSVIRSVAMAVSTTSEGILKGVANFQNDVLSTIGYAKIGNTGIPYTVLVMLIFFIVYGIILSKTKLGRSIYMIGGNPMASKLCGINSKKISYFLFINCSLMGGLAGLVYTFRSKQGSISALSTDQFTGMTAAILGGISFGGGSGGLGGAFLGLFVIKTFNKGMQIVNSNTYLTTILSGALLLAALTIDFFSQRRQRKRVKA